eukprot:9694112-Alexandrium_andersonii.AAC.1
MGSSHTDGLFPSSLGSLRGIKLLKDVSSGVQATTTSFSGRSSQVPLWISLLRAFSGCPLDTLWTDLLDTLEVRSARARMQVFARRVK